MGIYTYRAGDRPDTSSPLAQEKLNKVLADSGLNQLKQLLASLSAKHNLSPQELASIAQDEKNITIPMSIYSDKRLSMLEATVKYLKEELSLRFSAIGKILNRNERTIWVTYSNAKRKSPQRLKISQGISMPVAVLSDRRFSALEQAVGFLKEAYSLRFSEIARILKRDDRTVWTCYFRLKKKREIGRAHV